MDENQTKTRLDSLMNEIQAIQENPTYQEFLKLEKIMGIGQEVKRMLAVKVQLARKLSAMMRQEVIQEEGQAEPQEEPPKPAPKPVEKKPEPKPVQPAPKQEKQQVTMTKEDEELLAEMNDLPDIEGFPDDETMQRLSDD